MTTEKIKDDVEMSDIYVDNNGKGWAVFKKNPGHHKDYAWCNGEWSLGVADYFEDRDKAEALKADIEAGIVLDKNRAEEFRRQLTGSPKPEKPVEAKAMTREEWYNSPKFLKLRLLNQLSHSLKHTTQQLHDLLRVLDAEEGPMMVHDKFNLAERQLRVVDLEAVQLARRMDELARFLEPSKFEGA